VRGDNLRAIPGNVPPDFLSPPLYDKTAKTPEIDVISLAHVILQYTEKTLNDLLNIYLL
jgi:hypothetical protein